MRMWSASSVKLTKGTLLAAGAALVAVAAGGGAIAATKLTSPKQEQQAILDDAASQLGISPAKLSDALETALENRIDAAVKDGRITKEQGAELKANIEAGDFPLFAGPRPFRGHDFRGGFGFGPGFVHPHPAGLEAAATYLGLTQAQLREALGNGKTLAQIAKDEGKSVQGLIDAMTAEATKKIDAAAAAGKITRAQADDMKEHLTDAVTDIVNGEHHFEFRGGFGPGFVLPHPAGLEAAATYLGLTQAQLLEALGNGKTLAQIAEDKGKSVQGLVDVITAEATEKIDAAAAAGKITKAQADDMKEHLTDAVTDIVNGEHHFELRREFRGGPGFFGHRGPAFLPPRARGASA
jgi:hypothetical protein